MMQKISSQRKKKLVILAIVVVALSTIAIPIAHASLFKTYGDLKVWKESGSFMFRVRVRRWQFSLFGSSQPSTFYKWTVYRRLPGEPYFSVWKNEYERMPSYKLTFRGLTLCTMSTDNHYYYNVQPGQYKVKAWFDSNCDFQGLTLIKSFTIG